MIRNRYDGLKPWHVGKLKNTCGTQAQTWGFSVISRYFVFIGGIPLSGQNNDLQVFALYIANSASELLPPFSVSSH